VRVEQQLRQLVRSGAHPVGRERNDLHAEEYLGAKQSYESADEIVVDPRLAHVVLGAGVPDLEHTLLVVVAADRDHREIGLALAQPLRRLHAVDPWHLDVHHDRVDAELLGQSEALAAVPGPPGDREPAVGCEHRFERGEEVFVVFGDEDAVEGGVLQSLPS